MLRRLLVPIAGLALVAPSAAAAQELCSPIRLDACISVAVEARLTDEGQVVLAVDVVAPPGVTVTDLVLQDPTGWLLGGVPTYAFTGSGEGTFEFTATFAQPVELTRALEELQREEAIAEANARLPLVENETRQAGLRAELDALRATLPECQDGTPAECDAALREHAEATVTELEALIAAAEDLEDDVASVLADVNAMYDDMQRAVELEFARLVAETGDDVAVVSWSDQTMTVVPEPGTLLLLGTGLAGIAGFGRRARRRRKAAP